VIPTTDEIRDARELVARLQSSELYRNYETAFENATGLPLGLRAAGSILASYRGSRKVNAFCALLAQTNKSCAACLQLQQRAEEESNAGAKTLECYAGLSETAVPIKVGERVVAYLQTGQVLLQVPSRARFRRAMKPLAAALTEEDREKLEAAYLGTRVMPRKQYDSIVQLLSIFAQQLSSLSNQLMVQASSAEPPVIARARRYIEERHAEEISLSEVARTVGTSAFYFCKMFKKATGLTFTHYLARVRLEKVKAMLQNPHVRVSEAAFAAGFQSLSQFNRVFLRLAGEPPSVFRERLHGRSIGRCAA